MSLRASVSRLVARLSIQCTLAAYECTLIESWLSRSKARFGSLGWARRLGPDPRIPPNIGQVCAHNRMDSDGTISVVRTRDMAYENCFTNTNKCSAFR